MSSDVDPGKEESENKDEFVFKLKGKKFGGKLEHWVAGPFEETVYWGAVFDSPKERFTDGDVIKCSKTVELHYKDNKPYILETKNSFYYLGERGTLDKLDSYYKNFYIDKDNYM